MNVQFGCGKNRLDGWINHDKGVDISKPLPFGDGKVDNIFIEHCLEHISPKEALGFLDESYRILSSSGMIRIAVPSVIRMYNFATEEYCRFFWRRGWSDGTLLSTIRSAMLGHGHQSWWTEELLHISLKVAGFEPHFAKVGKSKHSVFMNIENHHKRVGIEFNEIETIVAEGIKNERD